MKLQAVFFDFDGVIVDSAPIKTAAFAKMFRKYGPDIERRVVDYHLAHQGISRFDKFRYSYENILNVSIDQNTLTMLGQEFSRLVLSSVIASPQIPGIMENLIELHSLQIPTYVVSGTPDEEIRYIVRMKRLNHYFTAVYGSPPQKIDILRNIINQNNYAALNCLFLGDSLTDFEAAREASVKFLGIINDKYPCTFPDKVTTCSTIPSLFKYSKSAA